MKSWLFKGVLAATIAFPACAGGYRSRLLKCDAHGRIRLRRPQTRH